MTSPRASHDASSDLWQRARIVFDDVAAIAPEARAALLAKSCADDPQLREAVESLLAHDVDDSFLELPWEGPEGEPETPSAEAWLGSQIGPYRLTRELGRGSSGLVFLAERDDAEFEHRVAVKVLARVPSSNALQRFQQERQILARLEHPNIARLIGGGTTPGGRPYLMIEWVDGLPLTTWCDQHRQTLEQRLELFREICKAVQYAHRNLIVHRDLKPSNILVTREGHVKLLDFGIAKLLADDHDVENRTETRWMTPSYASPEQLLGLPITTSSDIYSLGVLLYELLCGQRPRDGSDHLGWLASPHGIPSPPSASVEADIAAARRLSPGRLEARLQGDLDEIVLRALHNDTRQRWATAEELANDIRRHLRGLPVEARRGGTLYRLGKFVRRHRAWVATAAVLLLMVLGTSAVAIRQSIERTAERDLANREKIKAETVANTMIDLFRLMEPVSDRQYNEAAKRILDQGSRRVERDFTDQPEIQATLRNAVGSIYRGLGFFPEADSLLQRALAQRRELYGAEHLEVAETLQDLGELRTKQGQLDDAGQLLEQALDLHRRLDGEPQRVADNLGVLGTLWMQRGEYATAEEVLREAIAIDRQSNTDHVIPAANRLNVLGLVMQKQDRVSDAERLFEEALATYRRARGEDHINVATVLNNLASLYVSRGDFASGARNMHEALAIWRKLRGDSHPEVQVVVANLAVVLHQSGQYAAAEPLYREAIANQRRKTGDRHPDVAVALNNFGVLLRELGKLDEARQLLLEALTLRRDLLGEDHPDLASTLNNVGLVELDAARLTDAEISFRKALEIARASLGEEHRMVGISLGNLAKAALAANQPRRALTFAEEGDAVLAGSLPADHWRRAENASLRGAALSQLGDTERGVELLELALQKLAASRGKDSRQARDAAARLAQFGHR